MSSTDTQVGGDPYRQGKIQPVEYIEANGLGFLEGCVVKRVTRHNRPGGKSRQDIEKAIHELQLLLELRYGDDGHSESPAPKVTVNETRWVSSFVRPETGRRVRMRDYDGVEVKTREHVTPWFQIPPEVEFWAYVD